MIFELRIKDFILIEDAVINFKEGLNIITGETGAGKSMILGAIGLIMGEQANRDAVRIGAESAIIKASFYTTDRVNAYLSESGYPVDEEVLVISREVQAKGKTLTRINGEIVTLNVVKGVTQKLINIHGQNDNQTLLQASEQLELLDAYGHLAIAKDKALINNTYSDLIAIQEAIEALEVDDQDKQKQMDFLQFQLDEILSAALKPGEDVELEREFEYISNLGRILETFESAKVLLSGEYGDGFVSEFSKLSTAFAKISRFDDKVSDFSDRIKEAFYGLEDLSRDLEAHAEHLEYDQEAHHRLETRLDDINRLKTKYGQSIDTILEYQKSIEQTLEDFNASEEKLMTLKKDFDKLAGEYDQIAERLTTVRMEYALKLERALQSELIQLNMEDARVKIECKHLDKRSRSGLDEIDIQISTNKGQPFRSLKKVVSGGELSRIMLAMKVVLGETDQVPTLIFDEIDAGISGITANVVGEKMSELAQNEQLICITHLPQIAVFADHHLKIEKQSGIEQTVTVINTIEGEDVISEISRLVGGLEKTEATIAHAKEMLKVAQLKK